MSAQATLPEIEGTNPTAVLPAELELVLRGFRLRAQRRKAWLQNIWRAAETQSNPTPELADADSPIEEARWMAQDAAVQRLTEEIAAAEAGALGIFKDAATFDRQNLRLLRRRL